MARPQISIVVPVYRNSPTLRPLRERIQAVMEELEAAYEIVFVDDGSPDDSARAIQELAADDASVVGLILERNGGQNRAVLTGLRHARGDVAVVMDADLQDPPEAIPALLAALRTPLGAVFAGRRGRYEARGRLVSSWLFKHLLHLLSRRRIPADAGLFVAMSRPMIDRLLAFREPKPYVLGLMGLAGLPLASIAVQRDRAPGRESGYSGRARLKLAYAAFRILLHPPAVGHGGNGDTEPAIAIREWVGARFQTDDREQQQLCVPG